MDHILDPGKTRQSAVLIYNPKNLDSPPPFSRDLLPKDLNFQSFSGHSYSAPFPVRQSWDMINEIMRT